MLFNQVALAQHVCVHAAAFRSVNSALRGTDSACHGSELGKEVAPADLERIACAAHCSDADKRVPDLAAADIPFLAGSDVAHWRPLASATDRPAQIEARIERRSRHTIDHSVLLI